MKTAVVLPFFLMWFLLAGCGNSSVNENRGSIEVASEQEFTLSVPPEITLKQGDEVPISVVVNRGNYFSQEVTVSAKSDSLQIDPQSIRVKSGDRPEVWFRMAAGKDLAPGMYAVFFTGNTQSGITYTARAKVHVMTP